MSPTPSEQGKHGLDRWNGTHLAIALVIAILALMIRVSSGPHPIDDAYITFRYAHNLATGHGLVYNPGETVLGTSTPLYSALLAISGHWLGVGSIPTYSLWLNAISDSVSVAIIYLLARRIGLLPGNAVLTSLLFAVSPLVLRYSVGGMEVSLATAMLLVSLAMHIHGKPMLRDAVATLVIFVRLDAALALVLFVASDLWDGRGISTVRAAVAASVVLAGMVLSQISYGLPIPHSILAKSGAIYQATPYANFLQFVYGLAGIIVGPALGMWAEGNFLVLSEQLRAVAWALFVPQFAFWILGAIAALRASRSWAPFFVFPLAYSVIYSLLGLDGALISEWYLVLLVPFYLVGIALSLQRFFGLVGRRFAPRIATLALGALIATELAALNLGVDSARAFWLPDSVQLEREMLYREIGIEIASQDPSPELVAASEIGALGYFCECRILDTVGLVSPVAIEHYPVAPHLTLAGYAVPPDLIQAHSPDYVVSLEIFIRRTLLDDDWFLHHYELTETRPTAIFGSQGLLVYRLRGTSP